MINKKLNSAGHDKDIQNKIYEINDLYQGIFDRYNLLEFLTRDLTKIFSPRDVNYISPEYVDRYIRLYLRFYTPRMDYFGEASVNETAFIRDVIDFYFNILTSLESFEKKGRSIQRFLQGIREFLEKETFISYVFDEELAMIRPGKYGGLYNRRALFIIKSLWADVDTESLEKNIAKGF